MALAWDRFESAPGAADLNFEVFCRALVQRRFGHCGSIRSRRNQPGVEFYLPLDRTCDELGEPGRVWGWQTKWFDLPASNALGIRRQEQIEESIDATLEHVREVTDFVLCLRELPKKSDIKWYFDLAESKGLRLHLWAEEELEARLTGGAEVLRQTFFGELVLTETMLSEAHARALAPIGTRWLREAHVRTHVEDDLDAMLLRPGSLDGLSSHAVDLRVLSGHLREDAPSNAGDDGSVVDRVNAMAESLDLLADRLEAVDSASNENRALDALDLLRQPCVPTISRRSVRETLRQLRTSGQRAALAASAVEQQLRYGLHLLRELRSFTECQVAVVVAVAGHGKTQLAASVSSPGPNGRTGVFIPGSRLRVGGTLSDLAKSVAGFPSDDFDLLLEALDTAGARAGVRIPLVIDGLNEAQRPSEWRPLLDSLIPVLPRFPNVLLVLTMRTALVETAVPEGASVLDLEWQNFEVEQAVKAYFRHYLIDASGAWVPMGLFANPLLLRMYCEAANGPRQHVVGAAALPSSLMDVFDLYRERVSARLANDPAHPSLPPKYIEKALARLALTLWEHGARTIGYDEAKDLIDTPGASWDDSPYRRLEEEGVLFRDDFQGLLSENTGVMFDWLAGYLIADALLASVSTASLDEWASRPELWDRLVGESPHPLAEDIWSSLVGLLPRRLHRQQLWQLAPAEHRGRTLLMTLDLESHLLDDETVDALAEMIQSGAGGGRGRRHPYHRLWEVAAVPDHRLNADFLDRVLRGMSLAERDRKWTEWARSRFGERPNDELERLVADWSRSDERSERDSLRAQAVCWLLTSTDVRLRDLATKALQRFGQPLPQMLFNLGERMAQVDDLYVQERLHAAIFGATSTHQMPDPGGPFERALAGWLSMLAERFLEPATAPTSHELIRTYVRSLFEFAAVLHPGALPPALEGVEPKFAPGPQPAPISEDDSRAEECDETFGMDFENYVIGSLVEGRHNYESGHAGYVEAVAEVRGRVWDLGWRSADFRELDRRIAQEQWHRERLAGSARVERYGKKYGWIAHYELAGRLDDAGGLRDRGWLGAGRSVTPDVDPSFPDQPTELPGSLVPDLVQPDPTPDERWIREGVVSIPDEFLLAPDLSSELGPWLLVEGFVEQRAEGRRVWGLFRSFLVDPSKSEVVAEVVDEREYLGNRFIPSIPKNHGVYAGELPWSPRLSVASDDDLPPNWRALHTGRDEPEVQIELLATEFAFEGARTETSFDRNYPVPSYEFAHSLGLRARPGTLHTVLLDGSAASFTFGVGGARGGYLLYLRSDLVERYAAGRSFIQVGWGEREVPVDWTRPPPWYRAAQDERASQWQRIAVR